MFRMRATKSLAFRNPARIGQTGMMRRPIRPSPARGTETSSNANSASRRASRSLWAINTRAWCSAMNGDPIPLLLPHGPSGRDAIRHPPVPPMASALSIPPSHGPSRPWLSWDGGVGGVCGALNGRQLHVHRCVPPEAVDEGYEDTVHQRVLAGERSPGRNSLVTVKDAGTGVDRRSRRHPSQRRWCNLDLRGVPDPLQLPRCVPSAQVGTVAINSDVDWGANGRAVSAVRGQQDRMLADERPQDRRAAIALGSQFSADLSLVGALSGSGYGGSCPVKRF